MIGQSDAIVAEIDLRVACDNMRDQGARPTCLACATSDAHAMHHNCPPLSVEFLFYNAIQIATVGNLNDGILFEEAAAALEQNGQPAEHEWPYSVVQPDPWVPPLITIIWQGSLSHGTANAANAITELVRKGRPVVLGIKLSAAFLAPIPSNFSISKAGNGFGGHAVLVVGLGQDTTGQNFFLIRNSWGLNWANGGYAWLEAEYLADKLIGFAAVDS